HRPVRSLIMFKLKIAIFGLLLPFFAFAQEPYFCAPELGSLPIQQGGRVKPLYVHANETIKYITGERKLGDYDAVTTYCILSLQGMGLENSLEANAKVEHVELKKFLGMKEDEHTYPLATLVEMMSQLQLEWRQAEAESSYKKALNSLLGQVALYRDIV